MSAPTVVPFALGSELAPAQRLFGTAAACLVLIPWQVLEHAWSQTVRLCSFLFRLRIEETWQLWQKFLDDYSRFEDWLKTSERTAAFPSSSGVLYTVAKEELKKFEVSHRSQSLVLLLLWQSPASSRCPRTETHVHRLILFFKQLGDKVVTIFITIP